MPAESADRERAKERGHDALAPIDAAYAEGRIDQDEWHRRVLAIIEPAYLAGDERMGSGHSGTADEWESSRSIVMEAIDRDGTFLDIGCANGLLMASVHRWSADRGLRIEPYGVDIAPVLADLARSRYPQWSERIWLANAASWRPPMRFDLVRTGLEYVPADRRRDFVQHLIDHVVQPGGRLIIGKTNEDRGVSAVAVALRSWGWPAVQEVRQPHDHPDVEQTLAWFDAPTESLKPPLPRLDPAPSHASSAANRPSTSCSSSRRRSTGSGAGPGGRTETTVGDAHARTPAPLRFSAREPLSDIFSVAPPLPGVSILRRKTP